MPLNNETAHCRYCPDPGSLYKIGLKRREGFVRICGQVHYDKFMKDCEQYGSIDISLQAEDETSPEKMEPDN